MYVLPVVALLGFLLSIRTVIVTNKPKPIAPPFAEPARAPFQSYVAGSGIVEASSENVAIASPVGDLVAAVNVAVGDTVKKGTPLFTLDQRALNAQLQVRKGQLEVARASLGDVKAQFEMWTSIQDKRAVSGEDFSKKKFAVTIAEAKVKEAEAEVFESETLIDRAVVRSPLDGKVLQIKVRAGEFAPAQSLTNPLMLIGAVDQLHVRVDIDENDSWRVKEGAAAKVFLRGNNEVSSELTFVRFEPYVVPKRSLTGESTERVDTRVLQVIFSFDPAKFPVFVGQQVDVFIEAQGGK